MGVTIHFKGRARDRAAMASLLNVAERFASERGWNTQRIYESATTITRVDENEQNCDYTGPTEGIELRPGSDCEQIRLEFGSDLVVQDWTKTQFAGPDMHFTVVQLLRSIEPYFEELQVTDESEFWETGDGELLKKHMNNCSRVIEELRQEHPHARVNVRLPSGRIIDIIT